MRVFQHALRYHAPRTATPFLGWLEAEDYCAGNLLAVPHEHARRREQDRGVRIVPTGVHRVRGLALVLNVVLFLDGQRVHIGAQEQRLSRLATTQDALHARDGDAGMHLIYSERTQPLRDDTACTHLLKPHLRVHVEIAPRGDQLRFPLRDFVPYAHRHCHTYVLLV